MVGTPACALPLTPLATSAKVHVWSASLDQSERRQEELTAMLAPEELERASGIVRGVHRRRFVAGRGMLRALLSRYLDLEPARVRLVYDARGKPEIMGAAREGLHFNVSHSCDRVVYAVGRGHRVGVDIEQVRPVTNVNHVARRFFSPSEHAALQALSEERRLAAFFRCWTRKEALAKGRGEGISDSLRRFDVTAAPGDGARSLHVDGWELEDLIVDGGYVAAVAVEANA
jgi:4'-phosphopantetheinyl transferase